MRFKPAASARNRVPPESSGQRARHIGLALGCVLALVLGGGFAHADSDHDRARAALQAGEVLPLTTILERLQREHPGKVLDVDLERDKGDKADNPDGVQRWVYEIKLLTPSGTRQKLLIDAKTGALIATKRRD